MSTVTWVCRRVAVVVVGSLMAFNTVSAQGDLSFIASRTFVAGSRYLSAVGVGDFDGDGQPDVAVTHSNSATVSILLGNGDGTFQPEQNFGALGISVGSLVVGDFNSDGRPDLAAANGQGVSILVNDTPGASRIRPSGRFPPLR